MPCDDITEVIEVKLGATDTLEDYSLRKRTCGAEIGAASLLLPLLAGSSVASILSLDAAAILSRFTTTTTTDDHALDEFLYLKHLTALQEALRVLIGEGHGSPDDLCATVSVGAEDDDSLRFVGLIKVTALTEKIKACGGCGSCGTHARNARPS